MNKRDYVKQVLEENLNTLNEHKAEMERRESELKMELLQLQQRLVIMEEMSKQIKKELETR